jgi:signal transduction histidine kinase
MSELLENPSLPAAKREEFTANMRAGLFRMEWLVLALLKMAKLDAGAAGMQRESVFIWELADMSARALDVIISGKNQRVVMSGDRESMLTCDISWTAEALSNIIKNASEHTPENGEITVTWDENPLTARITVRDGGDGIDPADLPHLFKRFYKGSSSRGAERIGIGLALSLEIMCRQNGDIEARNAASGGAEFVMRFYR